MAVDVRTLDKNKDRTKIAFMLKGVTLAYANTLRRVMINKVPTHAIEYVEFRKNSSTMYDEVIAHRLGLIPLKSDIKSYNMPKECKCNNEGCARCQVKITIKAKGPGTVYSSDLKSADPKIVPVFDKMPIVKLLKGQELELEATAVLGTGKEHIKWCPCMVHYKQRPNIVIKKEPHNPENIAAVCPVNIFEYKKDKFKINQDNVLKCILCDACVEASKDAIEVQKTDDLIFYIECWGQLQYKKIVQKAYEVIETNLDSFMEKIKKLE